MMRWLPIFISILLLSLSGCRIYGYQPAAISVPRADSAGVVEVAVAGSYPWMRDPAQKTGTTLPNLAGRLQITPMRWLTIGVQASVFRQLSPRVIETSALLFHQHEYIYQDYERRGSAIGGNVGWVGRKERSQFLAQVGSDVENIQRSFWQSPIADAGYSKSTYWSDARYLKPWVQASWRHQPATVRQFSPVLALRASYFKLLESKVQAEHYSPYQIELMQPSSSHFYLEGYGGIEWPVRWVPGLFLTGGITARHNRESNRKEMPMLWRSARFAYQVGLQWSLAAWRPKAR